MVERRAGWDSTFKEFSTTDKNIVVKQLEDYIASISSDYASDSQITAWDNSVDRLQVEVNNIIDQKEVTKKYDLILEYELPLDSRRPDNILLLNNSVAVIEFKGAPNATKAAIDQTHAYARDLSLYHRECHERKVHPILVNMSSKTKNYKERGVNICNPNDLAKLIIKLDVDSTDENYKKLIRKDFLAENSYCPLPSLITAARELFDSRKVRKLWNSIVNTDEATIEIENIIHEAYKNKTKHLVLVTGVPGAGKTLVGLRVVHNAKLDQYIKKDSVIPAVFLSGNDPLVEVLQYELKISNDKGKTFIHSVRDYIKRYKKKHIELNEHLLVFDEAQRAWNKDYLKFKHIKKSKKQKTLFNEENEIFLTEPEYLVNFADRSDDWSVIVGLIGTGQEIHYGEQNGMELWVDAIKNSKNDWMVHGCDQIIKEFKNQSIKSNNKLHLEDSVRSHKSNILHKYVNNLLDYSLSTNKLTNLYNQINENGFDFYVTRNVQKCRKYLHDRYSENNLARYGKITSSRTKDLEEFGFKNDLFKDIRYLKKGPWFANGRDEELSCCNLDKCVTEIEIQGLELDATWLCWGKDFVKKDNNWDISRIKNYNNLEFINDLNQLRVNAYRVLLTRARDACLVLVPEINEHGEDILLETYQYLKDCGMKEL